MLLGFVLTFGLPRIFKWASGGDIEHGQSLYGTYRLVIMGVSFINNGIITGTIQAVSKFTSEAESHAYAVRHAALKIQGLIGICIAILYVGFAGVLANALGSPDLANLMRISAGIIVAYSCYAVFIGSFNGRRLFSVQALFDIFYVTVKTVLIVGFAAAGFEVLGAVVGFLVTAIVFAIVAAFVSPPKGKGIFPIKQYFSFALKLITYTFLLNLVMSLDLFLLKGIISHSALESGQSPDVASQTGKVLAGMYAATQGLAFIPYQAILSIAFVAFPMISKVTFEGNTETAREYVRKTIRFTAILIFGLAAVFAALPAQSLGLVFPVEYQPAADSLAILSLGIAAFGLMVVSNTILNGAGLPGRAMVVVTVTLLAVVTGVVLFVGGSNPDESALAAAALGSSLGMAVGLVFSALMVYHRFGGFCPWSTGLRVALATTIAVGIGRTMPQVGKITVIGECVVVLFIYWAVLLLTKEFGQSDFNQLKEVLGRRKT
jgi:O-antigen/teichoic acid export membrane protein